MMNPIGVMPMPDNFRYRTVYLKGKPQHDRFDAFRLRHPLMQRGRRAKIFAPFDALKGFGDALASQGALSEKDGAPGTLTARRAPLPPDC